MRNFLNLIFSVSFLSVFVVSDINANTMQHNYEGKGKIVQAMYGDKKMTYRYDGSGNLLLITRDSMQQPALDITANNSSDPITVTYNDTITLLLSLAPGAFYGEFVDWWLVAKYRNSKLYYNVEKDSWITGETVAFQGMMLNNAPFNLLKITGLPPGRYNFDFSIDTNMNGKMDEGRIYSDTVVVNITE